MMTEAARLVQRYEGSPRPLSPETLVELMDLPDGLKQRLVEAMERCRLPRTFAGRWLMRLAEGAAHIARRM